MVNNYSETQMKTKPTKWRAIEISNRWTKPMESPASKPSPQIEPQKTRSSLRVNTSAFLFGTASIACHTTDKKTTSRRGYNSLFLWDTIYVPPTDKEKNNGRKPMSVMRHQNWPKSQSPNNGKQTALSPQNKERKILVQSPNRDIL